MTTFKTQAEIAADGEFIQYLEKLRSASPLGTNRAFERLASNLDAVLEETNRLKVPTHILGNIALAGTTLSWGSTLTLPIFSQLNGVVNNTIAAGSITISAGQIAWLQVTRTSAAAFVDTDILVDTYANFLAALNATPSGRLDLVPLAMNVGGDVIIPPGQWIRDGYGVTNGGATDTQYAQQTDIDLLRVNQKQNLNIHLIGGGDITWDEGTTTLTWSGNFRLTFPTYAGYNQVPAGSVVIPANNAWYATLSRAPSGVVAVSTGVASLAGGVPDTDNTFILAVHNGTDDRVYLADGTALSDAETVKLGGVRIGVQWYFSGVGAGVQVLDLAGALGPSTSYRVGSGELMVYRNGVKAVRSRAFWEGGTYPTGSLNTSGGAISAFDDYVEEDSGDGTGSRIIWLEDGSGDTIEHTAGTHDPPLLYPDVTDYVEAFIGVQGQAPTVTVPDGIYGFERVWSSDPNTIRTSGGYLVAGNDRYALVDDATGLELTVADMVSGETLSPGDWHYIYLAPAASTALPPQILLSTNPPATGGSGAGVHPTFPTYRFLSSVYVTGTSTFASFEKSGDYVHMNNADVDMGALFSAAITGGWVAVGLGGALPDTAGYRLKLLWRLTSQVAVGAGDRLLLQTRATGFPAPGRNRYAIKPANSNVLEYEFDVMVSEAWSLGFQAAGADFQSVDSVILFGYSEGRHTSGSF